MWLDPRIADVNERGGVPTQVTFDPQLNFYYTCFAPNFLVQDII